MVLLALSASSAAQVNPRWFATHGPGEGCNGQVLALAAHPDGRIAVGGSFSSCGSVIARNVAIFDPATNSWSSTGLAVGQGSAVYALAWFQGRLIAGGSSGLFAAWDGQAWISLSVPSDGFFTIRALVTDGDQLYIGGAFGQLGGQTVLRIARWDGSTMHALGEGTDGEVNAIAVRGAEVYVAGAFSRAGNRTATRVARWDGTTWSSLGSGTQEGVDRVARAVAVIGGDVYVGGDFLRAGGQSIRRLARWDGTTWHPLPGENGSGVNGNVHTLAAEVGELWVGGAFDSIGGVLTGTVARWSGSSWTPTGGLLDSWVFALAPSTNGLVAGGYLGWAGGRPARRVAMLTANGWKAMGSIPAPGLNSWVADFEPYAGGLVLAGGFTSAGGETAVGLVHWAGGGYRRLGNFDLGYPVVAHAEGQDLYVGGAFLSVDGVFVYRIARFDGRSWHAMGQGLGHRGLGNYTDTVWDIVRFQGDLYAAGQFNFPDFAGYNLARWDGQQWVPAGWIGRYSGSYWEVPLVMAADPNHLYVGGTFLSVNGEPIRGIARWNGSEWSMLGEGLNGDVYDLAIHEGQLYAVGDFTASGTQALPFIGRWDGEQWHPVGVSCCGSAPSQLLTNITIHGQHIYVGSASPYLGSLEVNHIARFDGLRWTSLGTGSATGTDGPIYALRVFKDHLHVGGAFTFAGGEISDGYARWGPVSDPVLWSDGFEAP